MKIFLLSTLLGFILLTVLSLQIHTTDSVTLYGYPMHFYKHEAAIPAWDEYEAHYFYPKNLLIDIVCASVVGLMVTRISRLAFKNRY
jgi:hypothetical protein